MDETHGDRPKEVYFTVLVHRLTKSIATAPPVEQVVEIMKNIQLVINENGYTVNEIFNADETGFQLNATINYKYTFRGKINSDEPNNSDKSRITAMLGSNSSGVFLPCQFIVKCRSKANDQVIAVFFSHFNSYFILYSNRRRLLQLKTYARLTNSVVTSGRCECGLKHSH